MKQTIYFRYIVLVISFEKQNKNNFKCLHYLILSENKARTFLATMKIKTKKE